MHAKSGIGYVPAASKQRHSSGWPGVFAPLESGCCPVKMARFDIDTVLLQSWYAYCKNLNALPPF